MNIINVYILITALIFLFFYKKSWKYSGYIFLILSISLVNEFIQISHAPLYKITSSIYIISIILLWLSILTRTLEVPAGTARSVLALFVIVSLINILWIERFSFNKITFIAGSFIYLLTFIIFSFKKLKQEDVQFFSKAEFLLISAPLLFFLGLSFLFGFRSYKLTGTFVSGNITLYTAIAYFVNIIYYSLINLYIFKKRKESHA